MFLGGYKLMKLKKILLALVALAIVAGVVVLFVMGGHQQQIGTFLLGAVDGFRRLDMIGFGQLILGQDDPVPQLRVPADGHGHLPVLRVVDGFHGGKIAVAVRVENDPVRGQEPGIGMGVGRLPHAAPPSCKKSQIALAYVLAIMIQ